MVAFPAALFLAVAKLISAAAHAEPWKEVDPGEAGLVCVRTSHFIEMLKLLADATP